MTLIQPINDEQQQQVYEATRTCINRAGKIYGRTFEMLPVRFDLQGGTAGMYRIYHRQREIRYNPYLFAKYYSDNLAITVPHEVAHYITDCLHGLRHVRPHGPEWQAVMQAFGADASRTCRYDLDGIPQRRQQRHPYRCGCDTHQLTTLRHNRISQQKTRYRCRRCGNELLYQGY